MRNRIILGISLLFCFSLSVKAQEAPLKISLKQNNITIAEVLEELEKQTGLLFAYRANLIREPKKTIEVDWEEIPLEEAIHALFPKQKLSIQKIGNSLIIKEEKPKKSNKTLHGFIRDQESGEALIGANILLLNEDGQGANSNQYGFFTLSISPSEYQMEVSYIGYESQVLTIDLTQDQRINIELEPVTNFLESIVISANSNEPQTALGGRHVLDIAAIKTFAAIGGEPDVIKVVQNLPGIKTVGEGSSGMYVRGGNIDQNLILLDEAPIYNPSHLLGFFSVFHPDAIHHAELFKGNFPVEYGGRLSSVLNLKMKEGNKENISVSGGAGLLASRVLVEGPIKKEQHSFMLAARRSYPDIFLNLFSADEGGNKVNFSDFNAKLNFSINPNNQLYLSAYSGRDIFRFFDAYENTWGNTTATLRWNRIFSDRFFGNLTAVYSRHHYSIDNFIQGIETFNWESGIRDIYLKANFTWYLHPNHKLKFGTEQILHRFEPGKEKRNQLPAVPIQRTLEQALYIGHQLRAGSWSVDVGFRGSAAHNYGETLVYTLDDDYQIVDSTTTGKGIYHSMFNLSPRLAVRYQPSKGPKWQLGLSQTVQYLQELRNAITGFNAFYTYLPSGVNLPAQSAMQVDFGVYQDFKDRGIHLSMELYYKWLRNQVDFVPHSSLLQNPFLESDLRVGKGTAYGVEVLVEKKTGTLNGAISYNFARSFRTIPAINEGKSYPTYFDQPHAVNIVLRYQPTYRWLFSCNWRYNTGGAVTLPVGSYQYNDTVVPIYGERNGQRLPNYHRLDLAATLYRKKKEGIRNTSFWVFSLYNVYYRKNTLSIDILPRKEGGTDNIPDPTDVGAFKTYLFGTVPSIGYHFKF